MRSLVDSIPRGPLVLGHGPLLIDSVAGVRASTPYFV